MLFHRNQLPVYVITPPVWPQGQALLDQVEAALKGGATIVQVRRKPEGIHPETGETITLSKRLIEQEAVALVELCHRYQVPCIINDDVPLAMRIDADGVHVGQDDMPCKMARQLLGPHAIIGVSASTVEEAQQAYADGANYIGAGAVFPTSTKGDATALTLEDLQAIVKATPLPVVAIGGITAQNIPDLACLRLAGYAVISHIFQPDNGVTLQHIHERTETISHIAHRQVYVPTALTIAGSDCSGGAGIQADLKTMAALGVYGMSAITALTAQNTTGVKSIMNVTPAFLQDQLDMIFDDIPPATIKIGMLSTSDLIHTIATTLAKYPTTPVVLDPVMVATSGAHLIDDSAIQTLITELIPLATMITPNIPEAEILYEAVMGQAKTISNRHDMEDVGLALQQHWQQNVLLKGGHAVNDANDLLITADGFHWIQGERIHNPNTHGTGCTLSSAIASHLALGYDLENAIKGSKSYIIGALRAQLNLGAGSGPLDHGWLQK